MVLVPGVVLAGLTVIAMVAGVLVTVCRVMVCTAMIGMLVMVFGVALAAGVLVPVIGMTRVRPGMAWVFLVCR
ncbi:hypothetical protein [Saccharomonospora sp. CUA-673]|uniref:hypothetical protein n=1 Tax=Saccharomonospora sp. CUA-673 TaxID=1904969 RepID=UPI0011151C4B|nr:hypothetical protein [Saccharomonospora sp. CUA-673]